ncbi:hypothetical protein [Priestia megaterium]|uniref:hypothetical protein n=1 Tax=Priestia megaterium TaxID=1404 RepID=UPI0018A26D59|nr:hypothetical protein [Priestia megaterium]MDR7243599.1 hypothetical protein [Priestia megaterium]USL41743.1 hypothetical protein LIS78_22320 [Priestia megaterium]
MENQIRSDFFKVMVNVDFIYIVGSSGRPRKAKPCMEINSVVTSDPYYLICSYLD